MNKSMLIQATLDLFPPKIRRSLLDDRAFIQQWNLAITTSLALGKSGPSFRRDGLFDGIRSAIRNQGKAIPVNDNTGKEWQILVERKVERLTFSIAAAGITYALIDHSALAEEEAIRTSWLEQVAQEKYLDGDTFRRWLLRLRQAALSDDEFTELITDLEQTPANAFRDIRVNMETQEEVDVNTLVPDDHRYYERLVGKLGHATAVAEYIEAGVLPRIAELQNGNGQGGFKYSLLLCSSGKIAERIQISEMHRDELIQAYQWLAEYGDPISRIGAVEIALSHLDAFPELGPFVARIVEDFLSVDPQDPGCSFALLSAMTVMVASELVRKRTLGDVPPFYLRQAAFAHASLVIRAINDARIETKSVTRWAHDMGVGQVYFLHGLVSLRCEPRWLPDFISADQLRFEFIGRIMNAVHRDKEKVQISPLGELLIGSESKLVSASKWPYHNFPGPMEGAIASGQPYPDDLLRKVKADLEADHLEATDFAGLTNAALLFDMQDWMADLAAVALRRIKFSIEDADDEDKAFNLISGLAILAAVTRGKDLADALRVLTRVMRHRKRLSDAPDEELRVAMIAAASFENLEDWARFAGEWLTEIAFETTEKDAASAFLSMLRGLVQIEPALARHCARADAALDAFAH